MSMGKRNGLSRGDARRNARLLRMRGVVRPDLAILAIDLADTSQALVLCDHDSRVLARRVVAGHAWRLDEAIGWGQATAISQGFAGVVVGCEPTGHRWRIVAELCQRRGSTWCACSRCWSPAAVKVRTSPATSPIPKTRW
jgi:transposase